MSYPAPAPSSRLPVTGYVTPSPPTGERFEHAASARTAADGRFRFVWTLDPGKTGPGEHVHEEEDESFEIVSGTLRIWIEGAPTDYTPGDRVTVPARVPHRFLNPGEEPVVVNVALTGTRMEDALVPIAVATHGRMPRLGEVLRMLVGFGTYGSSTAVTRRERWATRAGSWLLRLFGVCPFAPVLGWERGPGAA